MDLEVGAAAAADTDLQAKRPLDLTPVVLATEFGLRARINDNDGWDYHDDEAFTCMPASLGSRAGRQTE